MQIKTIVSGGQAGADIGALDAAIHCELPHSGWCPKGRKQEKRGRIPEQYNLTEMDSPDYMKRTEAIPLDGRHVGDPWSKHQVSRAIDAVNLAGHGRRLKCVVRTRGALIPDAATTTSHRQLRINRISARYPFRPAS